MIVLDRTRLIGHLIFYLNLLKQDDKALDCTPKLGELHKMLHKYLHQRGNSYHFRWRIPADLRLAFGMTELTRSLHTPDWLVAGVRAARFVEAIAGIKKARWAYLAQEIDVDIYASELEKYWKGVRCMARKEETITTEWITFYNPDGTKFCKVDHKGDEKKEALGAKELKDAGVLPEGVTSRIEPKQGADTSGMLFSELFEKFIAHKIDVKAAEIEERKPLSKGRQKEHTRYFNVLLEIMGDISVTSITKQAVKEGLLTYRQLPQRNKSPYNRLPVSELLEMEIPSEDIIASKTIIEARKTLQGIFRYALDINIIDVSPARDLNLKLDSKSTFSSYSKAEVRKMLAASHKESAPWKRWLLALAAYTGARRGELVQLRKEDVKLDSDSGRHYLLITDEAGSVKNENAKRQVPIHNVLIDMGLLEFVDSASDRLFNELKPQAVTGWFARFRHNLEIKRFDDFGNRKVFHSFRHTFITQSRGARNSLEHVQQVVGHEKSDAGVTDRYSHRLPVSDVLGVVDKISYK